ncbi:MAG: 50S ribosomal protein L4 [Gemmatimonadaceae bacterium]|nr:50S ribosomal protein L4 [Gemmatimonadaceae bacterium]
MADETTLQAAAYTAQGTARDKVALPEALFDGTVNMPVMHQAVKAYLANQRQGNAATKIRKYVIGGNQKPWRQKGTGRARQGSTRAPQWVGGGTVFGPIPRSYAQYVPRQVRALARKSAFNARAREDAIIVIDRFDYDAPKTSRLKALIDRLDLADHKVLILTDGVKPNVFLSGRNLPTAHVMPYADVSTYHLLWSDVVLVEAGALGQMLAPVAETAAEPRAKKAKPASKDEALVKAEAKRARKQAPKAKAPAAKAPAAKAVPTKKAAPKAAKKPAAKKTATKKPSATKKKGK